MISNALPDELLRLAQINVVPVSGLVGVVTLLKVMNPLASLVPAVPSPGRAVSIGWWRRRIGRRGRERRRFVRLDEREIELLLMGHADMPTR